MENYLVSVVIPCYNVEKYIDRCLVSVVNQTYKNLEIILIDDGSTDTTSEKCDIWASKDYRIQVIHKENDGLANARNSGIDALSGDYVLFVDSDDFIDTDMVEFLLNLSVNYNAEVSRCSFYRFENGRSIPDKDSEDIIVLNKEQRFIDLIDGGHLSGVAWNKLYRADVVKNHYYEKSDGASEDILYNFRVYHDIEKSVYIDKPKYHYCFNDDSITNSSFGYGAFSIIRARKIMLDEFKDNITVYPFAVKWFVRSSFIVLSGCIKNDKCMDKYDELRSNILKYKKQILFGKGFTLNHRLRTILLIISPKIYNIFVKVKGYN